MIEKVYFESDFALAVTLPDGVGDSDFELELCTDGSRVVKFYRTDSQLSPNLIKDKEGQMLALLRNHGLTAGKLMGRFIYTNNSGLLQVARWRTEIELTPIAIDASTIPTLDLVGSSPQGGGQPSAEAPAEVLPAPGEANTKTIKITTIKFSRPIGSADVENVKLVTPTGVLLLGYGGGDYTIDGDTVTINWALDAVEGDYELRIPRGAFTLDNGVESAAYNAGYSVVTAPVVYFSPVVTPSAGSVEVKDLSSIVVTLPSEFGEFNPKCDTWYDQMYIKYYDESLGYEQTLWLNTKSSITVSEDGLSITLTDWAFEFEKGVTYEFNIPAGYIVLANEAKNAETKIAYTVTH